MSIIHNSQFIPRVHLCPSVVKILIDNYRFLSYTTIYQKSWTKGEHSMKKAIIALAVVRMILLAGCNQPMSLTGTFLDNTKD